MRSTRDGAATIDGDRRRTWIQFRDRVARFAGVLRAAGVQPGDRVAILALNSDAYLEYFYAAPWAGALVVPLNTRLAAPELSRSSTTPARSALIVDETFAAMLPALVPNLTSVHSVFVTGGGDVAGRRPSLDAAIATADPIEAADPPPGDLYGIFYTGGTTAASKGVMLSHGNIVANATNMKAESPFNTGTIYLHAAPMFHLADCSATFALTDAGGTHAFMPRFDPVVVHAADSGSRRHQLDPGAGDDRHAASTIRRSATTT